PPKPGEAPPDGEAPVRHLLEAVFDVPESADTLELDSRRVVADHLGDAYLDGVLDAGADASPGLKTKKKSDDLWDLPRPLLECTLAAMLVATISKGLTLPTGGTLDQLF